MREKRLDKYLLVLIFALLHGAFAEVSILIGFNAILILTMLTMVLSLMLSMRQQMGIVFMVVAIIVMNFLGLWLGEWMGVMVRRYLITEAVPLRHYLAGPLATTLTTCVLGFFQTECAFLVKKHPSYRDNKGNPQLLVLVLAAVLIIRMAMMLHSSKSFWDNNVARSFILDYGFSMVLVLWMFYYVLHTRNKFQREKKKRQEALYSYDRLKKQIEPHFLFNSLNTLSSILSSGQTDDAQAFIQKLSSIYRYLLENEDEQTIYLGEELAFVQEYVDLLKIRFPEGLDFRADVNEEQRNLCIIPCSLQLLVENAVKHNALSEQEPLNIRIYVQDDFVVTTNNLRPKITALPSTGNGQRYIRNRYRDETGREIVIEKTEDLYIVKLPLL